MTEQYQIFAPTKLDWIAKARKVARRIAEERGRVDADDIWRECPIPECIPDRRLMAAAFSGLEKIGQKFSTREICHHRQIAVFRMPETGQAE